jgi:hypothetical protein
MTAAIMTQDILGICLLVAGGDLSMSMADVILRVEEFQTQNDRHFGITDRDFRKLVFWLIWRKIPHSPGTSMTGAYYKVLEVLKEIKLQDIVLHIIEYSDAYFNDDGEHWLDLAHGPNDYDRYNCSLDEYNAKPAIRKEMIAFFQNLKGKNCPVNQIQDILVKWGINQNTLYACSREGSSH